MGQINRLLPIIFSACLLFGCSVKGGLTAEEHWEAMVPDAPLVGETELIGVLFHNKISEEFAEKFPLEDSLYEPAHFAKAFNLEDGLSEPGSRTRMLELGGIAYWPEGAAVALFFRDNVERTVVPVYTLGKVLDDVRVFEEYEGSIRITPLCIDKAIEPNRGKEDVS